MYSRFYSYILSLAKGPWAPYVLAFVSFAESSFFPLPPDLLLAPMCLAKPERARYYAGLCTITSVIGGVAGYMIGAYFYETWGHWLIDVYGYGPRMEELRIFYAQWGWAFILIKGLTPIPYKLVTILSGILDYNIWLFILFSIITRGGRFYIMAGVLNRYSDAINQIMKRYFVPIIVSFFVIVIAGFWMSVKYI